MPIVLHKSEPQPVRNIKVQIGDDWIAHHFGKPVTREQAIKLAQQIVESLA